MIEITELTAGYGKKEILHNVSAVFENKKIISVIGANGSGKSTLMQCCAGLIKHWSGDVIINGKSISEYKSKELAAAVAYLPQINNASAIKVKNLVMHGRFPYLGYPRHYSKADLEIAENAMKTVGIEDIAEKNVGELSGGQQQKVHIAMRLAQDTEYIILDEPATYLDIKYQLELYDLMERLREQGKTIVTVMHDINAALYHSDKVLVMSEGRVLMSSAPEEIAESGVIEKVFGVKLMKSECGQYLFEREDVQ